ncbi:hypothetical protein SFC88_13225 [Nocardioides sp. HM23]|uniref:hypothetical protein n=1 Tax=Nocardioides bizhenqiangii TaxID=3095076 RepID=UPI002ACAA46C|nr:hypothetical protein [Nocardioides sp. HM23]MDZ5621801.1 hypothetical protein [Nocardioides sp. HM23]
MANESESVPPSDWLPEPPARPASEPPARSASEPRAAGTPYVKLLVTYACVVVMGMALTWAFLSMRAVAGVGGSCGSGGAYEISTPCPDGSWLIALGIPLLLVSMFLGSGVGMSIGAPATLLPMWALLFTSLGWNFLEFGFADGVEVAFLVCGVVFWAMALPAWWAMFAALRSNLRAKLKLDPERRPTKAERKAARARVSMWAAGSLEGSLWWWLIYAVLLAGGALFGVATYAAAA